MAQWKRRARYEQAVRDLARVVEPGKDGIKVRDFLTFEQMLTVVQGMIECGPADISLHMLEDLIRAAVVDAGKEQLITPEKVICNLQQQIARFRARPRFSSTLVTTVSLNPNSLLQSRAIRSCRVEFQPALLSALTQERRKALEEAGDVATSGDRSDYTYVTIHTEARNTLEAFVSTLEALDVYRGAVGLAINPHFRRTIGGHLRPVNAITLGQVHSVHDEHGRLLSGATWYEPEYIAAQQSYSFFGNEAKFKLIDDIFSCLEQSNYARSIEDFLIDYARALDPLNHDFAFLKLWAALERMCGVAAGNSGIGYEALIKRVAFLFEDVDYNKIILEHLRSHRNSIAHGKVTGLQSEVHLYLLKKYVVQMLRFHLGKRNVFDTMQEALEFLDHPVDSAQLSKRLRLINLAIEYRSKD